MNFKLIFTIIGMVFLSPFLFAHTPDLSSLMIYEQNGKNFIAIKSSLAAFEGEVIYHYGKDSYKTPKEFNELVFKHFKKSCFVVVNNDTIKFKNLQIQLGHETTFFAELENVPQNIRTFDIKHILFKDMPNNQCELILSHKDFPKEQFILNNDNLHQVKLLLKNGNWILEENQNSIFKSSNLIYIVSLLIIVLFIVLFLHKNRKT